MIKYKIDVLEELKKRGYTTTVIRKKRILAESTLTRLREGKTSISCDSIGVICSMLRCQPSYIIQNTISDSEKIKLFLDAPALAGSSNGGRLQPWQNIFIFFKKCVDICTVWVYTYIRVKARA